MKKTKLLLIFSMLALLTTAIASVNIHPMGLNVATMSDESWVIYGRTITINNNGNFSTYAASGNGSASNPYLFENLVLDGNGSDIFHIYHTTAYFTIRNCVLFNASTAININNASNGNILNNTITACTTGVYIEEGSNFHVINNTITYMGNNGFETNSGATYIELFNNTLSHNGYTGAYLWGTNHSVITENTIKNNTENGLTLDNLCINNTIAYNTLDNNTDGLELVDRSNFNRIRFNTMNNNSVYGIYFDSRQSNFNRFLNNSVNFNGDTGIYSDNTSHNTFINNTFNGNQYDGVHLGAESFNFTFLSNEASLNLLNGFYIECTNNTLTYNRANNNTNHGIYLEEAHNSTLTLNTANGNGIYGILRDSCADTKIIWNVLHENVGGSVISSGGGTGNLVANNSAVAATLTGGGVTPTTGDTGMTFTFRVNYTDGDNLAPFSIRVIIDGTPHNMNKQNAGDSNYPDGCIYIYTTTLAQGPHVFSFECYDITHKVTTTAAAGPNVNAPPIPGFNLLMLLIPLLGLSLGYFVFKKQKVL